MKKILFYCLGLVSILMSCNNATNSSDEPSLKTDSIVNTTNIDNKSGIVKKKFSGMSIDVPDELNKVDEEKIIDRYPGSNRPNVVYGSEDMSINLAYSITKKQLKESDLLVYMKKTTQAIEASLGKGSVSQNMMDTINGRQFAVIEFYSPSPTGKIYNLMFTTSVNDNMAIFTFNCPENKYAEWEEDIPEIFASIRFD